MNVELILSQHDCKCATCVRSGNCRLQTIANDLGILSVPYETQLPTGQRAAWTTTYPLYRDAQKCIKCMRCIQICDKVQSLNIWDLAGTGGRTTIDVSHNRVIKDSGVCPLRPVHHPLPRGRPPGAGRHPEGLRRPGRPGEGSPWCRLPPPLRAAWGERWACPGSWPPSTGWPPPTAGTGLRLCV